MPFTIQPSKIDPSLYTLEYSQNRGIELDKIFMSSTPLEVEKLLLKGSIFQNTINELKQFLQFLKKSSTKTILLSVSFINYINIDQLNIFIECIKQSEVSQIIVDISKIRSLSQIDYPKLILLFNITIQQQGLKFTIYKSNTPNLPVDFSSAFNIFNDKVDIKQNFEFFFCHLLDSKPKEDKELLRDLLPNNIDCYLPGSSIPANENQIINYFLPQVVLTDIIPVDIIEHSVEPFCRNIDSQVTITPEFYSSNPHLYNEYIEFIFMSIKTNDIADALYEQFTHLVPLLNDATLVATSIHAAHYKNHRFVEIIAAELKEREQTSCTVSATDRITNERMQEQKDCRSNIK